MAVVVVVAVIEVGLYVVVVIGVMLVVVDKVASGSSCSRCMCYS